jgi:hypothetical protein
VFAPRRTLGWSGWIHHRVTAVAATVRVVLARVALASGVALLTEPGWGLLVFGVLVAAWPRRAAR